MEDRIILSRAQVFEKEQELKRLRIEEEFTKRDARQKVTDRISKFSLKEIELRKGDSNAIKLIGILERDAQLIRQAVTFINPALTAASPLCPGAVYLIGAASGTGKSTTTAAIAHGLYLQGKNTFVISNEETEAKILARIACVELGIDFNLYVQDKLPMNIRKQIAHEIQKIEPFVSVADDPIASTTVESISTLIQEVDDSGKYSCIVIDFLQRISKSIVAPAAERTQVLYTFKDVVTDYAQHAKTPIVVMTQLIPLSSDETERNVETRIKFCKGFYEAAASVIEVIKIKGIPASTFYVAKGRFSKAEVGLTCKFENGKFIYINKHQLKDLKDEINMQNLRSLTSTVDDTGTP